MVNYRISSLLSIYLSVASVQCGYCAPETSVTPKPDTGSFTKPQDYGFHNWRPFLSNDWLEKLSKEIKAQWSLDSGALHDETVKCECAVDNKGHLLTINIKKGSANEDVNQAAVELLKKVPPIDRGYYNHRVPPFTKEVVCDDGIKRKMMAMNSAPLKYADSHWPPINLFVEFGNYPNVTLTEKRISFGFNSEN